MYLERGVCMRKARILSLLVAFCVLLTCSFAQAATVDDRTISVNGSSTLKVAPDKATINVSIETLDKDAKVASAQNAAIMNKIQKDIMALAIPKDKIKTINYNLYQKYDYDNGKQKLAGYAVSNEIMISVDNIDMVGTVIDTAINAGATNVNSVEFGLKDDQMYRDKALQQAILDAKRKAEVVAGALGRNIVDVKSIDISNASIEPRMLNSALYLKAGAGASDTSSPIQAGNINIKADVNATFTMN